jgi:hypothetical protein
MDILHFGLCFALCDVKLHSMCPECFVRQLELNGAVCPTCRGRLSSSAEPESKEQLYQEIVQGQRKIDLKLNDTADNRVRRAVNLHIRASFEQCWKLVQEVGLDAFTVSPDQPPSLPPAFQPFLGKQFFLCPLNPTYS